MSKHQMSFELDVPIYVCVSASEKALVSLNWRILAKNDFQIRAKQPFRGQWPVTLDIRFQITPPDATLTTYCGSNFGVGPFNNDEVKNAIVAVHERVLSVLQENSLGD